MDLLMKACDYTIFFQLVHNLGYHMVSILFRVVNI